MADLPLIQALRTGESGAWEEFVPRVSDLIYKSCALVFTEHELATEYLRIVSLLRAHDFALLRAFDGRATLSTYLTLKLSDLLANRILELFDQETERAWQAFERFFKQDIMRIIAKYFPPLRETWAESCTAQDHYQEICLALIEQRYHRIKSYDGRGSFAGYIRRTVQHLCVDLVRKTEGRRRLPEGIKRLSALEQVVFKLVYWEEYTAEQVYLLTARSYEHEHVAQALARVQEVLKSQEPPSMRSRVVLSTLARDAMMVEALHEPYSSADPEATLLAEEAQRMQESMRTVLQEALKELPAEVQLYLHLRFFTTPPQSPREIARLMGRSEDDVYKLRQQAVMRLKASLESRGLQEIVGAVRLKK